MSASLLICRQQFASESATAERFTVAPGEAGIMPPMPDVRHMDRAPVDGGHVEYLLHGSGDPMLFIHGAGIADAFVPLMNRPPLAGLQQIHYRRRGYGQSTAAGGLPESFMARAAADAAQLLAHLRVDAAHVVGHSSGAIIALDLAARASRRAEPCASPAATAWCAFELVRTWRRRHLSSSATQREMARWRYSWPLQRRLRTWVEVTRRQSRFPVELNRRSRSAATFFESELPGVGAWQFDGAQSSSRVRQPVLFMMESATRLFHTKRQASGFVSGGRAPSTTWFPAELMLCRWSEPAGVAKGLVEFITVSLTAELPLFLGPQGSLRSANTILHRRPFAAHPWYWFGPYEISAQIGVGGMGEVYRATDTNRSRQVAHQGAARDVCPEP